MTNQSVQPLSWGCSLVLCCVKGGDRLPICKHWDCWLRPAGLHKKTAVTPQPQLSTYTYALLSSEDPRLCSICKSLNNDMTHAHLISFYSHPPPAGTAKILYTGVNGHRKQEEEDFQGLQGPVFAPQTVLKSPASSCSSTGKHEAL